MTNQIYIHPWKYARCETCKISEISQWVNAAERWHLLFYFYPYDIPDGWGVKKCAINEKYVHSIFVP